MKKEELYSYSVLEYLKSILKVEELYKKGDIVSLYKEYGKLMSSLATIRNIYYQEDNFAIAFNLSYSEPFYLIENLEVPEKIKEASKDDFKKTLLIANYFSDILSLEDTADYGIYNAIDCLVANYIAGELLYKIDVEASLIEESHKLVLNYPILFNGFEIVKGKRYKI